MADVGLTRVLRDIHHFWHPRDKYLHEPLLLNFRNLLCSTADIWRDAHNAIHGRSSIGSLRQGLYLPPVMPDRVTMARFIARHDGKRPCKHGNQLIRVNIFALSQEPWNISTGNACAYITVESDMLELIRATYHQNPRADPYAHRAYLRRQHREKKCTCFYAPTTRHVSLAPTP